MADAALNVISSELETRGFFKLFERALGLTCAAMMIGLTGLVSGIAFAWLSSLAKPLVGSTADVLFRGLAWIAALSLGTTGFALIMRYGPDRRHVKWRWMTPGAILATLLWMARSFGLSICVLYISNYSATYGSLSAVVVFLMWLYLSAHGLLLGALVNAELERQTAMDSTAGPDRRSARAESCSQTRLLRLNWPRPTYRTEASAGGSCEKRVGAAADCTQGLEYVRGSLEGRSACGQT